MSYVYYGNSDVEIEDPVFPIEAKADVEIGAIQINELDEAIETNKYFYYDASHSNMRLFPSSKTKYYSRDGSYVGSDSYKFIYVPFNCLNETSGDMLSSSREGIKRDLPNESSNGLWANDMISYRSRNKLIVVGYKHISFDYYIPIYEQQVGDPIYVDIGNVPSLRDERLTFISNNSVNTTIGGVAFDENDIQIIHKEHVIWTDETDRYDITVIPLNSYWLRLGSAKTDIETIDIDTDILTDIYKLCNCFDVDVNMVRNAMNSSSNPKGNPILYSNVILKRYDNFRQIDIKPPSSIQMNVNNLKISTDRYPDYYSIITTYASSAFFMYLKNFISSDAISSDWENVVKDSETVIVNLPQISLSQLYNYKAFLVLTFNKICHMLLSGKYTEAKEMLKMMLKSYVESISSLFLPSMFDVIVSNKETMERYDVKSFDNGNTRLKWLLCDFGDFVPYECKFTTSDVVYRYKSLTYKNNVKGQKMQLSMRNIQISVKYVKDIELDEIERLIANNERVDFSIASYCSLIMRGLQLTNITLSQYYGIGNWYRTDSIEFGTVGSRTFKSDRLLTTTDIARYLYILDKYWMVLDDEKLCVETMINLLSNLSKTKTTEVSGSYEKEFVLDIETSYPEYNIQYATSYNASEPIDGFKRLNETQIRTNWTSNMLNELITIAESLEDASLLDNIKGISKWIPLIKQDVVDIINKLIDAYISIVNRNCAAYFKCKAMSAIENMIYFVDNTYQFTSCISYESEKPRVKLTTKMNPQSIWYYPLAKLTNEDKELFPGCETQEDVAIMLKKNVTQTQWNDFIQIIDKYEVISEGNGSVNDSPLSIRYIIEGDTDRSIYYCGRAAKYLKFFTSLQTAKCSVNDTIRLSDSNRLHFAATVGNNPIITTFGLSTNPISSIFTDAVDYSGIGFAKLLTQDMNTIIAERSNCSDDITSRYNLPFNATITLARTDSSPVYQAYYSTTIERKNNVAMCRCLYHWKQMNWLSIEKEIDHYVKNTFTKSINSLQLVAEDAFFNDHPKRNIISSNEMFTSDSMKIKMAIQQNIDNKPSDTSIEVMDVKTMFQRCGCSVIDTDRISISGYSPIRLSIPKSLDVVEGYCPYVLSKNVICISQETVDVWSNFLSSDFVIDYVLRDLISLLNLNPKTYVYRKLFDGWLTYVSTLSSSLTMYNLPLGISAIENKNSLLTEYTLYGTDYVAIKQNTEIGFEVSDINNYLDAVFNDLTSYIINNDLTPMFLIYLPTDIMNVPKHNVNKQLVINTNMTNLLSEMQDHTVIILSSVSISNMNVIKEIDVPKLSIDVNGIDRTFNIGNTRFYIYSNGDARIEDNKMIFTYAEKANYDTLMHLK